MDSISFLVRCSSHPSDPLAFCFLRISSAQIRSDYSQLISPQVSHLFIPFVASLTADAAEGRLDRGARCKEQSGQTGKLQLVFWHPVCDMALSKIFRCALLGNLYAKYRFVE
jgi:hypothetical protein